jgi:hypothetical protein
MLARRRGAPDGAVRLAGAGSIVGPADTCDPPQRRGDVIAAANDRDMHPLDSFRLDGFVMLASSELVVRRRLEDVWQLLAAHEDTTDDLPAGVTHVVIERFKPGEHRCTVIGTVNGREVCSKGFRRLLAHREVLEVQSYPAEDHLVRTTYTALRFGRTRINADAGVRPVPEAGLNPDRCATAAASWQETLRQRHAQHRARLGVR